MSLTGVRIGRGSKGPAAKATTHPRIPIIHTMSDSFKVPCIKAITHPTCNTFIYDTKDNFSSRYVAYDRVHFKSFFLTSVLLCLPKCVLLCIPIFWLWPRAP